VVPAGDATPAPTVMVIDDYELIATSLVYMLRGNGFDAMRIPVTDVATVVDAASRLRPGVALVDLDLGPGTDGQGFDGVDLVVPLRAQGWTVLIVTGSADIDRIAAAVAGGAANWVVKNANFDELVAAATEAAQGRGKLAERDRLALIARHRNAEVKRRQALERMRRLSSREREVLGRLADGVSPAGIAELTFTSIGTVRAHIRSILVKLEVNSQLGAVAIANAYRAQPPPISASRWRSIVSRSQSDR
jgi:DNA-binding NarL/FixJ family response regulator